LAAVFDGSQVGLVSYSDQKEKLIWPAKAANKVEE